MRSLKCVGGGKLLAVDAKYGSTEMDGKLKIINPTSLTTVVPPTLNILGQVDLPSLPEDFYVECAYAVCDADVVGEYFVVGLDDGTVHALERTSKSIEKPPKKQEYDQFCDSMYAHQDSIVSIEKNPATENVFLAGSKDGLVTVWSLSPPDHDFEPDFNNDFKVSDNGLIKFQEEINFK